MRYVRPHEDDDLLYVRFGFSLAHLWFTVHGLIGYPPTLSRLHPSRNTFYLTPIHHATSPP